MNSKKLDETGNNKRGRGNTDGGGCFLSLGFECFFSFGLTIFEAYAPTSLLSRDRRSMPSRQTQGTRGERIKGLYTESERGRIDALLRAMHSHSCSIPLASNSTLSVVRCFFPLRRAVWMVDGRILFRREILKRHQLPNILPYSPNARYSNLSKGLGFR